MGHTPVSKNEVENEIVWNNKFVTIAGKSVFYRSWYEAGVKSECPLRLSHIANMWHMMKNQNFFIFLPEIVYGKPRNVVGLLILK